MSEMRQRKGQQAGAEENTSDSPTTKASNYYNAFVCKAPSALAPYLSKAGPYVVQSTIILQQILPIFEIAYDKSQTLMVWYISPLYPTSHCSTYPSLTIFHIYTAFFINLDIP
jgi:hypothetical protein